MTQRPKRKKKCRYCGELFTPARATQTFCRAEHRRIFWDGMRTVDPKEFAEFLEWKQRQKVSPKVSLLNRAPAGLVERIADIPGIKTA